MEIEKQIQNYATRKNDAKKLVFGQILIGPPGSGKSTFCKAMYDLMKSLGKITMFFFKKNSNLKINPKNASFSNLNSNLINKRKKCIRNQFRPW